MTTAVLSPLRKQGDISKVPAAPTVVLLQGSSAPPMVSHPVSEGKPNANYVRARIRTHVHSDYINEHHRTMLE
jgi:hypothetical protein